jgi:hypothetical protein
MDEAWQSAPDLPPALALRRLILGHRVTQVIATAAQLGLADHLTDTPKRVVYPKRADKSIGLACRPLPRQNGTDQQVIMPSQRPSQRRVVYLQPADHLTSTKTG